MRRISRILCIAVLLVGAGEAVAQQHLSIEDAVRLAQDSSIVSFESRNAYIRRLWHNKTFDASRKFQLSFNLVPNYYKYINNPDLNYFKSDNYNTLSAKAEFRLEQQFNSFGGNFYASTGALWSEFFAGTYSQNRMFSVAPLGIGYANELLGFNPFKWDKALEDFNLQSSGKVFLHNLEDIALETVRLYMDYVIADSNYEIAISSVKVLSRLESIAREKFKIASIPKNELTAVQLQRINAENRLNSCELKLATERKKLLSYLCIADSGQDLDAVLPELDSFISIDEQMAMDLALNSAPGIISAKAKVMETSRELDEAARRKGMQVGLDLNLGVQSSDAIVSKVLGTPSSYMVSLISLKIPLVDHGKAVNRYKEAEFARRGAVNSVDEAERQVRMQVSTAVGDFHNNQKLLIRTKEALSVADESFSLVESLYGEGQTDVNTLILAKNSRDDAYQNYLDALKDCWVGLYKLRGLCLYDFAKREAITVDSAMDSY